MQDSRRLIFVYNTEAGMWNWITDYTRKLLDPDSYQCQLCKIISGNGLTVKKSWKDFIENLEISSKFVYLDEFTANFPSLRVVAPAVFVQKYKSTPILLISASEINKTQDLDSLIELIQDKVDNLKTE